MEFQRQRRTHGGPCLRFRGKIYMGCYFIGTPMIFLAGCPYTSSLMVGLTSLLLSVCIRGCGPLVLVAKHLARVNFWYREFFLMADSSHHFSNPLWPRTQIVACIYWMARPLRLWIDHRPPCRGRRSPHWCEVDWVASHMASLTRLEASLAGRLGIRNVGER